VLSWLAQVHFEPSRENCFLKKKNKKNKQKNKKKTHKEFGNSGKIIPVIVGTLGTCENFY